MRKSLSKYFYKALTPDAYYGTLIVAGKRQTRGNTGASRTVFSALRDHVFSIIRDAWQSRASIIYFCGMAGCPN